ncbi:MAG: LysR family transcriptional regulator [Hyphomicrobiales bacterium]|nr:LysR family transcriptional regulator [Hyphomicrobiales bacterium]
MKKFDDLFVFVAVVERGSFVGAARQLGLPSGTVSRKVQELETRLGITLLNRTTRSLSVTEVGREVYESASRGFSAIEEAESLATRHHDEPSGVLRVVAPYALLYTALLPLAPAFRAEYPDVRLEFIVTNQAIDLVENNCDVAFRVGAQPDSSYVKRTIADAEYRLVATPAALDRLGRPRRPGDLLQLPMSGIISSLGATTPSPVPSAWSFVKGDRREEMSFDFVIGATDPMVPLDFALRGHGVSILLETLARPSLEAGLLEVVLGDWAIAQRLELSLIYRRRATMDSKIRVFVEFVFRTLRRDPRLR